MPVVFVVIGTFLWVGGYFHQSDAAGVLGGPITTFPDNGSVTALYSLGADFPIATPYDPVAGFVFVDSAALSAPSSPLTLSTLARQNGLLVYRVHEDDTLSSVASRFGISTDALLSANPDLGTRVMRAGEDMYIIPVAGVVHIARGSETADGIARVYRVAPEAVIRWNGGKEYFTTGARVIVPGGHLIEGVAPEPIVALPKLENYFALPARGWNWGALHAYNAIDIANSCGTNVHAAAEGLISEIGGPATWNNGYGGYIDIVHPTTIGSVITRYAHLREVVVSVGEYVLQGDMIGAIGNTGKTHGATGCHLHFEVRGAVNPFAK